MDVPQPCSERFGLSMHNQYPVLKQAKIKAMFQSLDTQNRAKWRATMLFGVSIVIFIILLGLMLFEVVISPFLLWLIFMAIIVALLTSLGLVVNGRGMGILIDARNRISLSRLPVHQGGEK